MPGTRTIQTQRSSFTDIARSGVAPLFLRSLQLREARPRAVKSDKHQGLKDLYVSDFGSEDVVVLKNTTYKEVGTISNGLVSPDGDFLDGSGNLYVADYDGIDIQEYKPSGKSPSFTYNTGMIDPVNVSVDTHGNVYEADYDGGYVNEYAQKSNTVINSCPSGFVEGVAVDQNNDIFVDYNSTPSGPGKIAEYKGGLAGCNATVLGVTLDFAGGLVLDAHDNLIVCDETAPSVDTIEPPYTGITSTLGSGYTLPFHVTLAKNNKLAFVADIENAVYVLDYPSGAVVTTLGSANGLVYPAGAVDGPNAIY